MSLSLADTVKDITCLTIEGGGCQSIHSLQKERSFTQSKMMDQMPQKQIHPCNALNVVNNYAVNYMNISLVSSDVTEWNSLVNY